MAKKQNIQNPAQENDSAEHMTITPLENDFFHLVPDSGYRLYNTHTDQYHPEAVTKQPKKFIAVLKN